MKKGIALLAAVAIAAVASAAGCGRGGDQGSAGSAASSIHAEPGPASTGSAHVAAAAAVASSVAAAPVAPPGDPHRGHELAVRFQCSRCHEGTGTEGPRFLDHCVRCHQDILAGKFKAPAAKLDAWQKSLATLREVPSLEAIGKRYRREWLETFLVEPHDLRPRLLGSMPRLAITPAEARDLAAYLAPDPPAAELSLEGRSAERGRALLDAKGCGSCHLFGGAPALADGVHPLRDGEVETRSAVALAPDLRFARDRYRPAELVRWLLDPKSVKADTLMPLVALTRDEAGDMAAYILTVPLEPPQPKAIPERLAPLSRRVAWDEVYDRVFRKTCRHCHAEPDYALGDGGPGNTGGLGFAPRKLNLADYAGVAAGFLDTDGKRISVFAKRPDGTPWLVAALLARQAEEAGRIDPEVRGMPLALPALTPEEIQLVETWIAQGRPQ